MVNCNLKKNKNNAKCKRAVGEGVFSMIIPKADNKRNKIKHDVIKKHINKINGRFGGSTTTPTTLGCWRDEARGGKMQCETGMKVITYRDFEGSKLDAEERRTKLDSDYKFVKKVAKEMGKELGQDAIAVTYDNVEDVSFVPGEWKANMPKSKVYARKETDMPFKKLI